MTTTGVRLVVVGQGYVGLPVAMRAIDVGHTVVGIDLDEQRVDSLNAADSYVDDVSDATLAAALATGRYQVTTDYAKAAGFTVAVITVPTPLRDSLPDLSFIERSSEALAPHVTRGATIVLESTTYPGTTDELLVPALERGSGLVAGLDFFVGYSPERIDPGNAVWNFVTTPKVVSGINAESLQRVRDFYDSVVDTTVAVSGTREAELTKLLENTFRHVNIALVNELAIFAHELGVDVWEAIDAASTKPFGYMRFTPGPGVGGHCLPVDPSYLSWQVRQRLGHSFRFVELANDVNDHMPDYVVQRVFSLLNEQRQSVNGSRITIVGLAYKRNTSDVRESPALRIVELLRQHGAIVQGVDGHIAEHAWPSGIENVNLDADTIAASDLLILVTDHDDVDLHLLQSSSTPVLDTRNRLTGASVTRL